MGSSSDTPTARPGLRITARRVWAFTLRVLAHFTRNKCFLLAGGVAYNMILSIIPLLAVALAAATQVLDKREGLAIIVTVLQHSVPNDAAAIEKDIAGVLEHPELLGGFGLLVVLFFSSLAFRMLQDAMEIVFERPRLRKKQRSSWLTAFLPFIFTAVAVTALVVLTVVVGALGMLRGDEIELLGVSLGDLPTIALYTAGFIGEVLLFTAIYRIMPVSHVEYRRAVIGGLTAAILWEFVRRFVVWWFTSISLVSVVYGSLTTVIVVILVLEIAAVILLLGAQIIAELQHSAEAGVPWYVGAPLERTGATGRYAPVPAALADAPELAAPVATSSARARERGRSRPAAQPKVSVSESITPGPA